MSDGANFSAERVDSSSLYGLALKQLANDSTGEAQSYFLSYNLALPADFPNKPVNLALQIDYHAPSGELDIRTYETVKRITTQDHMLAYILARSLTLDTNTTTVLHYETICYATDNDNELDPDLNSNHESIPDTTGIDTSSMYVDKAKKFKTEFIEELENDAIYMGALWDNAYNTVDQTSINSLAALFEYIPKPKSE